MEKELVLNPHREFQDEEEFWNFVKQGIEEGEEDIRNGRVFNAREAIKRIQEDFKL